MQSLIIVTLAMGIVAASAQSCPLALTQFVTRRAAKGGLLEAAQNADSSYTGLGSYPSVSLARTTLPPCGVRQMHIHQNVDELIYLLDGYVSAYTAWGNGTICEQAELEPENSFVYPRNLVHGARNLDCDNNATYLAFFTAFDNALVNVAASAYNMPGGPFANYADPKFKPSLTAATDVTTLAFDPECLAYCTLGVKGGQQPGPSAGGKTRRSFKRL